MYECKKIVASPILSEENEIREREPTRPAASALFEWDEVGELFIQVY